MMTENEKIRKKLAEDVNTLLGELALAKPGSKEYQDISNEVTKLLDRVVEFEKVDINRWNQEAEHQLKMKQSEDDRNDKLIKNGLTAISTIGGFGLVVWGALKSWKFEEMGTITSSAGRKFMNMLLSLKR